MVGGSNPPGGTNNLLYYLLGEDSIPLLRDIAREILGDSYASTIWKRIEIIGDIAIIKKPFDININIDVLRRLGMEILNRLKYVKSIWLAITPVEGDYRTRKYIHLVGEYRSETIYREYGCSFLLDITKVYISPVLSYDHMRIAKLVRDGEKILNMFAGFGGYSIVASRYAKPSYILSIDINPYAVRYMSINIELNKVEAINDVIEGDALTIVDGIKCYFDRILMPLPELVYRAIDKSIDLVKNNGFIHPHIFIDANNRREAFEKASKTLLEYIRRYRVIGRVVGGHVIRSIGPRKYHVTIDIQIMKS